MKTTGSMVAVGTTSTVRGEIIVDRTTPRNSRIGTIVVDISQFRSDEPRRDNFIRNRSLESAHFPLAEFVPTAIEGLPAAYTEGRELAVRVTGDLKVRNVVRPHTVFAATLKLDGGILVGTATATVLMTDFGFEPPSILGIVRAENEVRIELRFVARPPIRRGTGQHLLGPPRLSRR